MRIDLWTLALQTINVIVLIWLLSRFLFRPVAGIIAARRAAADAMLSEAAATRAQAADAAGAVARQRQELADGAQRMLAEARTAAEAERATLLHQAAEAAARLQAEAQQADQRERRATREALEQESGMLGVTIATRLLQQLPVHVLTRAFMETLVDTLAAHPERSSLLGTKLELRCAVPLDAAAQAECRAMLARVLGAESELEFRTDPTLLAGFELAAPHLLIRNSWRADLQRITQALHGDGNHDVATQRVA